MPRIQQHLGLGDGKKRIPRNERRMQTGDSEGMHSTKFLIVFFLTHLNILEIGLSHSLKHPANFTWLTIPGCIKSGADLGAGVLFFVVGQL